ncbi:blast:Protein phyllopod [Drosophila guanche]|uniref:Blast:Protein phyllopod n=1 Tax=Drosophila guanche TaxID=7266 RepID=A0A3B0JH90_DROGU|nr:blast:Protein phyllopod [Drosophila guanche]
MSANNHHQVEPAAAVAASQKSASSEYLKRTCLICGCHTNQTINIYEPRSGPNIVQLIQAKFKFQPLNEDKFLCFSCNNWLINWHSLQALNSNDADSQSQSPSAQMGNNSSGSLLPQERARPLARPVAYVQPQVRANARVQPQPQPRGNVNLAPAAITYRKRSSSSRGFGSGDGMSKILRQCYLESVKFWSQPKKITQQSLNDHLRQFQEKSNLLGKVQGVAPRRKQAVARETPAAVAQFPNKEETPALAPACPAAPPTPPTHQRFAQPSVDGKVVAMFRRLGTTLSRESSVDGEQPAESSAPTTSTSTATAKPRPPQIMSPSKQRPRWTRTLDDDEVLLEFDSVISEVLPVASALPTSSPPTTAARRCLSYPITNESEQQAEEEEEEQQEENVNELEEMEVLQEEEVHDDGEEVSHGATLKHSGLRLPRGLSISLI